MTVEQLTEAHDALTLLYHEANRASDTPVKADAVLYSMIAERLENAIEAIDEAREALKAG